MQQVRVRAYKHVKGRFEYLFDDGKAKFEPIYDQGSEIMAPQERLDMLRGLNLIPPEDRPWFRVKGFKRKEEGDEGGYAKALKSLTPEAGSYILMSLRRRKLG